LPSRFGVERAVASASAPRLQRLQQGRAEWKINPPAVKNGVKIPVHWKRGRAAAGKTKLPREETKAMRVMIWPPAATNPWIFPRMLSFGVGGVVLGRHPI